MPKSLVWPFLAGACLICGCAMFPAWKTIPPPGGCDQCHTVPISANWQVTYSPAALTDESSKKEYFQTQQYTMPKTGQASSSLELRKVEDLKCFDCHKSPNAAHKGRMGRFHH